MTFLFALLLSSVSTQQLCYNANEDIGDQRWLQYASLLYPALAEAAAQGASVCIPLKTSAEQKEAAILLDLDATKKTLTLE